jgi:hypothetical protein
MFVQLKKEFLDKPAGERIELSDSDGEALVKQGVAEAISENTAVEHLVATAMDVVRGKIVESSAAAMDAALKRFSEAQSQARRHAVPAIFGEGQRGDPKRLLRRLAGQSRQGLCGQDV